MAKARENLSAVRSVCAFVCRFSVVKNFVRRSESCFARLSSFRSFFARLSHFPLSTIVDAHVVSAQFSYTTDDDDDNDVETTTEEREDLSSRACSSSSTSKSQNCQANKHTHKRSRSHDNFHGVRPQHKSPWTSRLLQLTFTTKSLWSFCSHTDPRTHTQKAKTSGRAAQFPADNIKQASHFTFTEGKGLGSRRTAGRAVFGLSLLGLYPCCTSDDFSRERERESCRPSSCAAV